MIPTLALAIALTLTPTAGQQPHARVYLPLVASSLQPQTVSVTGRIAAMPANWRFVTVWLAPFTPTSPDGRSGFFVLDPSVHPQTTMMPGGWFHFAEVLPGRYVLLAGPTPEEMLAHRNEWGWPAVLDLWGNTDVGEVVMLPAVLYH